MKTVKCATNVATIVIIKEVVTIMDLDIEADLTRIQEVAETITTTLLETIVATIASKGTIITDIIITMTEVWMTTSLRGDSHVTTTKTVTVGVDVAGAAVGAVATTQTDRVPLNSSAKIHLATSLSKSTPMAIT